MQLNYIDAVKPRRLLKKKIFQRKYPVVRQYDQIDCGPAALLSVLKFWGGDSSIVHIRELANTDAGGTNMLGLVKAAEKLGFQAHGATILVGQAIVGACF